MPRQCVYYKKMLHKGYSRCLRDNSIRRAKSCPCAYYKCSWFTNLKTRLFNFLFK